jgi:hypothetical protein
MDAYDAMMLPKLMHKDARLINARILLIMSMVM